ncbi:MAG: hypothetical protein EG822_18425 [Deltaproteobacteria bacterium]|nr:hypothetical protein [Deltaproteobacteria bacterium]TLN00669.1 MAG: hypothetical protein FDZ73_18690 [bacterium]
MISEDFAAILTVRDSKTTLDTLVLFDVAHDDSDISPIDQFIENSLRLNKIWAIGDPSQQIEPEMGILLLLGYISAVESYMRALIRRLIACDQFSQQNCESLQLSFGAALHHRINVLPEALLEETVFSGKDEITKALNKFIGIQLNNNKALAPLFTQYEIICQLRHCCVHRFGKLGAKNAINFGLQSHKEFLEKPVLLNKQAISSIADILITLVKSINIEVFKLVLIRSATSTLNGQAKPGIGWTWHKTKDKNNFYQYYSVFACQKDAQPSPPPNELYERFRKVHRKVGKK